MFLVRVRVAHLPSFLCYVLCFIRLSSFCVLCKMLPFYLEWPFLIILVLSNVYLIKIKLYCTMISSCWQIQNKTLGNISDVDRLSWNIINLTWFILHLRFTMKSLKIPMQWSEAVKRWRRNNIMTKRKYSTKHYAGKLKMERRETK